MGVNGSGKSTLPYHLNGITLPQTGSIKVLEYPPYQLSLGQKKKVAIAGLMVLEQSIIICDEPFSGLDGHILLYFKKLLDDWVNLGRTIMFSIHDVDLIYEWTDDIATICLRVQ